VSWVFQPLPSASFHGLGTISASVNATIDAFTAGGTGDVDVSASATPTIAAFTLSSDVDTHVGAAVNATIFPFRTAFTPASLGADVEMWFDASDSSTITITGSGVSKWADKSGRDNHATQSTDALRPTIAAAAQNGLDVLDIAVTDNDIAVATGKPFLNLPDLSALITSGSSVVFIAKVNNDPPSAQGKSGTVIYTGTDTLASHLPWSESGEIYDSFGSTARKNLGNPTPSLASWFITSVRSATNDYEYHLNGTSFYSTGTNTNGFRSTALIGKSTDQGGYHYGFDGKIAEIVVLKAAATTGQRQQLEGYLAWKWGVQSTLASDHPYKLTPPTNGAEADVIVSASATPTVAAFTLSATGTVADATIEATVNATIPPFTAASTLDPYKKSGGVTLSNGDRTATAATTENTGGGAYYIALTTDLKSSGKWIVQGIPADEEGVFGFANSSAIGALRTTNTTIEPGGDNSVGIWSYGVWYQGGVQPDAIDSWTTGDIVTFALDMDNRKFWVRKNTGNWNASGTANPATNTEGYDLRVGGDVYFLAAVWEGSPNPTSISIDPDPHPSYIPSGFKSWNAGLADVDVRALSGGNSPDMVLLLQGEDADGTLTFLNSAGPDVVTAATAGGLVLVPEIDTAQSKFGGSSIKFPRTGAYPNFSALSVNQSSSGVNPRTTFGTGDYTVDLWVRFNAFNTNTSLFNGEFTLQIDGSNRVAVYDYTFGTLVTGTTVLTTGTWYHVAVTRSGGNTRLFLNGTQEGSTNGTSADYVNAAVQTIGDGIDGWIDEFRVLKGTAAWTANFTPPTTPYASMSIGAFTLSASADVDVVGTAGRNQVLLLHGDGVDGSTTFTDSTGRHTPNGAAGLTYLPEIDTAQSKFGGSSIKFLQSGGYPDYSSLYVDNNTANTDFNFGTSGDFTIDFWLRSDNLVYGSTILNIGSSDFLLRLTNSGGTKLEWDANGLTEFGIGSTTLSTGTWYHIAITRSAGTTRIFVNGVIDASTTVSWDAGRTGGQIWIAAGFEGWIEEFRVVRDVALWTSAFTVPVAAYTVQNDLTIAPFTLSSDVDTYVGASLSQTIAAFTLSASADVDVSASATPTIPPFTTSTTLNPYHKGADIVLSGGNLTASITAQPRYEQAFSTDKKSSGKYVFQITTGTTLTSGPDIDDIAVFLANKDASVGLTGSDWPGFDNNSLGTYSRGGTWYGNSGDPQVGMDTDTFTASGTILTYAVDVTARKWWLKVNNGNWNTSPSADPATGAGGYDILVTGDLYAGVSVWSEFGTVTASINYNPLPSVLPSGFSAWDNAARADVDVAASVTTTIAAFTLSSAADVDVSASATPTIAAFTLSSAADVDVVATLSQTIAAFTLEATGTVTDQAITATVDQTIAAFTLSSDVDTHVSGSLSQTIADFTLSSSADVDVAATLSQTIAAFTLSSAADVDVAATFNQTIAAFTLSSAADVDVSASSTPTIAAFTLSSSGDVDVVASVNQTIDAFTLVATATSEDSIMVTVNQTIADFTLSSDIDIHVSASLSQTIAAFTLSSSTDVDVSASVAATIAAFTLSSDVDVQVSGSLSQTLAAFTLSSDVDTHVSGTLSQSIGTFTFSSSGDVDVSASSTPTIAAFTLSSSSDVDVSATLSVTVAAFTLSSDVDTHTSGTVNQTIADFTLSSAGDVDVSVSATPTIGDFTLSATAAVHIDGTMAATEAQDTAIFATETFISATVDQTIAAFTLAASADVDVRATAAPTIAAFTLSSAGDVDVSAAATPTIEAFTSGAEADVLVVSSLSASIGTFSVSSDVDTIAGAELSKAIADFLMSAAATVLVGGTLAATEAQDTSTVSGTVFHNAALAATEAQDTAALTGAVKVNGTLAATEAQDTAAFSSFIPATGTLAATEAQDTADVVGRLNNRAAYARTVMRRPRARINRNVPSATIGVTQPRSSVIVRRF
jgi:hypothetical protein